MTKRYGAAIVKDAPLFPEGDILRDGIINALTVDDVKVRKV